MRSAGESQQRREKRRRVALGDSIEEPPIADPDRVAGPSDIVRRIQSER
jgi:hypothetical protein